MKKVVINSCFGGYGLSKKAYEFLGKEWDKYGYAYAGYVCRSDPKLVECVETLGEAANGECAELKVVEYDDYNFTHQIDEYDGLESLMLIPQVHKSKLETLTTSEITEYLTSLGIQVVE